MKAQLMRNLAMAYEAMGLVFGSLSTTPLYLFSALPPLSACTEEDYLGLLSTIFWTLTLIAGLKCLLLVLHAHHSGPGGIFALFSMLCQHLRVLEKHEENVLHRGWSHKYLRIFLFCVTMLATSMLLGDGIITPSISVLSALEGIKITCPSISQGVIKIITVLLLFGLFRIQKFNMKLKSYVLSPIIITWVAITTSIGVYNIILYLPSVCKAISPYYMLKFLSIYGKKSWLALGASSICLTGVEAIFTRMEYLNKPSMQLGYFLGVYPSSILTYAGLMAYLIKNPENQSQAFYKFIPIPMLWPMIVLSTLAALVASQGLILSCFDIVKQCVESNYFPTVQIIHTSKEQEGQVYSTQVNYTLMVLCIATIVAFQNGNALSSAYGVMVMVVMISITLVVTMIMLVVWKVNLSIVVAFILFFGLWEACSLVAMLSQFPKGGFIFLLLPLIPIILVCAWVHKRSLLAHYENLHSLSIANFTKMLQMSKIARMPGICLIHAFSYSPWQVDATSYSPSNQKHGNAHDAQGLISGSKSFGTIGLNNSSSVEEFERRHIDQKGTKFGTHVTPLLDHYVQTTSSLHSVVILTCFHIARVPEVPKAARFCFTLPPGSSSLSSGLYVCWVQLGFAEPFAETEQLIAHLQQFIEHELAALSADTCEHVDRLDEIREASQVQLAEVDRAKADIGGLTCHMLGKPQLKLVTKSNFLQRFIVDKLYALLEFHDPIIPILCQVPKENILVLNMTYEI